MRGVAVRDIVLISFCATGIGAGCTTPGAPSASAGGGDLRPLAEKVRTTANSLCGYLADVDPLLELVASAAPGLSTAEAAAKAVCKAYKALSPAARARGAEFPVVAGIVVTGKKTR